MRFTAVEGNGYQSGDYARGTASGGRRRSHIRMDKFGNPMQYRMAKVNEKGYAKAYVELSGKLYSIEVAPTPGTNKKGEAFLWVTVTARQKRPRITSM